MRPHVYFIQEGLGGPIKIGVTGNPKVRRSGLQIGNPTRLHLLDAFPAQPEVEQYLHERLARHHIRGEWFRPHDDIHTAISDCHEQFVIAPLLREPVAA